MASYQSEREDFMLRMQGEGMPPEISRRILRHANTIQRLSVAECNGDYPCDNGERTVIFCSRCEAGYVRSSMRVWRTPAPGNRAPLLICPNCRAQDLIVEWCETAAKALPPRQYGHAGTHHGIGTPECPRDLHHHHDARCTGGNFVPIFQGDPRGACVKLKVPSGQTDDAARDGMCVPTRNY